MSDWLGQRGLDARFMAFVLLTMLLSTVVGGVVAGIASVFWTGSNELLLVVPFVALVGGGFLIPAALIAWLVPSAVVFAVALSMFRRRYAMRPAAQWAGSITTIVAAIALTLVLTGLGRDWDGIGLLMLAIGPSAILISPFVAGYIYS